MFIRNYTPPSGNFIVNRGNAKAHDVLELVKAIEHEISKEDLEFCWTER